MAPSGARSSPTRMRHELAPRLTEQLRKLIHRLLPANVPAYDVFRPEPLPPGSPFRGLHAFGFEDAPLFLRTQPRDRRHRQAIGNAGSEATAGKQRQRPFVLILGGSGSGKSSLARAGVGARLTLANTVSGVDVWRRADLHPASTVGQTPLEALAASWRPLLPNWRGTCWANTRSTRPAWPCSHGGPRVARAASTAPLRAALGRRCPRSGPARSRACSWWSINWRNSSRQTTATRQREAFVAALAMPGGHAAVWLVATMRSEFFARAIELPAAAPAHARGRFLHALAARRGRDQPDRALPGCCRQSVLRATPANG